jgi:hypothetical protein
MTHWTLDPVLDSYASVAILTLLLAASLLIRPSFRQITRRRLWILLGLRGLVVLLVLIGLLRPTRISTSSRPQSAVLLVLFDQSRSMGLPHTSGDQSRWQAQLDTLRSVEEMLRSVAREIEVRIYAYDRQLKTLAWQEGRIEFPADPLGDQTDIGSTLDEAVQRELGQRLAAVILLGDGAQTAYSPRVEVQQAGRTLARLDYPLYTVTFGPPGDAVQTRDVVIESLPEQYTVFVKNELPVKGVLRARGYVNQEIPVELLVDDAQGNRTTAGAVRLQPRQDGQPVPVEILYTPQEPGQYKLTLRAVPQAGERVTRNNELSAFLTVMEGGLRVVYLYGDLLGEQRVLRRSLNDSPDIQLDDAYLDPRNRARWPVDLGDLISRPTCDVFILESVDASALGEANLQALAQSVEAGRGLLMIGGFNSFGPGGYYGTPLADVLPITTGRFERQELDIDKPISRDLHLWGEIVMLPARTHPVTRLAAEETNLQLWQSLPALQGANRFSGVKPRAQVLAETADQQPLLVAGDYGRGRTLAFAGNSTRRWWQYGRQSEHRRFWRQVILWLARRDDADRNDVWIKLTQRRFALGASVTFAAGARTATGDVITDAELTARLTAPDGQRQDVRLAAEGDEFSGTLDELPDAGDYLIEIEASQGGQVLGTARANFQVLDRDIELSNTAPNYELMARLANLTQTAGGRPVAPEALPDVMEEIQENRLSVEVEVESRWQLADTALDAWLCLFVLVALLGSEWALRKTWGLV